MLRPGPARRGGGGVMAERIAYLDAIISALGWGHKVKRGGVLVFLGAALRTPENAEKGARR